MNESMIEPTIPDVETILKLFRSLEPAKAAEVLRRKYGEGIIDHIISLYGPSVENDTTSLTVDERLQEYADYRLSKTLLIYIPPILILLGTFGNILTFIILMRRGMRKYSTYLYLAMLSVTDTFVLYVGLLQIWIRELTGHDLREQVDWLCKFNTVISYTVSDYSVWLLLGVTSERYIATCHPLKAPSWCNRKRAIKVIVILAVVLFSLNAHFFWTSQLNTDRELKCAGGADYSYLVEDIWPWVDACIYSFIPFVVILILNSLIIRQVVHARKYRREVTMGTTIVQNGKRSKSHEKSTKLTLMLLTISFAFLITTLPMNTVIIGTAFWNSFAEADDERMAKLRLIRTITELLMYVNHSMNFFLYCATGQKFRHQLCQLFCRKVRFIQVKWASENNTQMVHRNGITAKSFGDIEKTQCHNVEYSKVEEAEDAV